MYQKPQYQIGCAEGNVTIVVGGRPAPLYFHEPSGRHFLEAKFGIPFSIRIVPYASRNQRIKMVATVDGLNVLANEPGSVMGEGMVSDGPTWECRGRLVGQRPDQKEIEFIFVRPQQSVAAMVGDTSNAGSIGVAFWRERHNEPTWHLNENLESFGGGYRGAVSMGMPKGSPSAGAGAGREINVSYGTTTFIAAGSMPSTVFNFQYEDYDTLAAYGLVTPRNMRLANPWPADPLAGATGYEFLIRK